MDRRKLSREEVLEIVRVASEKGERPDLRETDLSRIDLKETFLHRVDFRGASLNRADLRGAHLIEANLSDADLTGAILSPGHLGSTYLIGVDLRQAHLNEVDLRQADLRQADFRGAVLIEANLRNADLHRANLNQADLLRANLNGANLNGADLGKARIGWTIFADANLAEVKGLETVHHAGPSYIGTLTLFNPNNHLPEIFLRGCGVPEAQITYLPSLMNQPIQFYSCFISYSTRDTPFATRLHNDLQAKGVRCWYAPEDMAGGKKQYDQIDQAIRIHEKLLLVLSEHSLASEWVMTEIRRARKLEVEEQQRKLFPIRLVDMPTLKAWTCFDADTGKDLAVEVREYHIPDFSTWTTDAGAYEKAFDRLLRDLTVERQ